MPTMWCPTCRDEYREGFTVCSDCGSTLVPERPPTRDQRHRPVGGEPLLPNEKLVEVANVPAVEAKALIAHLRSADIASTVMNVGTAGELSALQYSEGSRVMVRVSDLTSAQQVLHDIFGADAVDAAELAVLAEQATGYSDPETGAVV